MRMFVLAVALTLVRSPAAGQVELIHVRPIDDRTANLLLSGLQRSPTLRSLTDRIEQSDVIVLCGLESFLRGRHGALVWLSASGDARYVRAAVLQTLEPDAIIATFGHELQHAIELIDASWVTSLLLFESLFRGIGSRVTVGPPAYDTEAARAAGSGVRRELKASPLAIEPVFDGLFKAPEWAAAYSRARETLADR